MIEHRSMQEQTEALSVAIDELLRSIADEFAPAMEGLGRSLRRLAASLVVPNRLRDEAVPNVLAAQSELNALGKGTP